MKKKMNKMTDTDSVFAEKVVKRKKPKKQIVSKESKFKGEKEDDLIEIYDVDDLDVDLSYYRDVASSMRDW